MNIDIFPFDSWSDRDWRSTAAKDCCKANLKVQVKGFLQGQASLQPFIWLCMVMLYAS